MVNAIVLLNVESAKINPGMTNMQDEINSMAFLAGLSVGDPNLVALALFGASASKTADEPGCRRDRPTAAAIR